MCAFFFQAEDGIRDIGVTGVQTCALPIWVLLMEINRLASHWVWFATGGMELGALTAMTNGFRAREWCLDVLELITGLRMNHSFVRPGGVAQDLPPGAIEEVRSWLDKMRREVDDLEKLLTGQPIW